MGRRRLPQEVRRTGLIVNILWSTYHALEEEGQVNKVASRILDEYVEERKKDVDDLNKME
jgi:hypothetical protein